MSFPLMKLVFECEKHLKPKEDHVLLYIANKVNEDKGNVAWCSYAYLSKKTGLAPATVKRACNSLKEKGILSWVQKKAYNRQYKTNHYTINYGSLRAIVNQIEVSERYTNIAHTDTQVGITVNNNNLINNLTNNLDTTSRNNESRLSEKQIKYIKNLTDKYYQLYSKEHYKWEQLYNFVSNFFLSNQSEMDWLNIGTGLPSPIEKGWLKSI